MSKNFEARSVSRSESCGEEIAAALDRAVRDAVPQLIEPRADDPDRAVHLLGCFVETVVGFALGAIGNHVITAVRRWFGDEGVRSLRRALQGWPVQRKIVPGWSTSVRDPARPLVGELRARMHVRVCHAGADIEALVAAVRAVDPREPARARDPRVRATTAALLALLATTDGLASRISDELVFGWRVYAAAIAADRAPSFAGRPASSRALWQAWLAQLAATPASPRNAPEQAGYIMLVR
jgi:hypothetical protein